jgi:hypothetical protein
MKTTIPSVIIALLFSAQSQASVLVTNADRISGQTFFMDTVGYEFLVGPNPLSVTGLGVANIETSTSRVGLWALNGSLLVSAYIPTNSLNANGYYWQELASPILLSASTAYLIAAYNPNGQYWYNGFPTLSEDVSLVSAARNSQQLVFSAPSSLNLPGRGIVGANLEYTAVIESPSVPEPSGCALIGLGGVLGLGGYRRRNRAIAPEIV